MSEYKCVFKKHIYREYGIDGVKEFGCDAHMRFTLPFVPYQGLRVHKGDAFLIIEKVSYVADSNEFYCDCEPTYLLPMDGCGYEGLKNMALQDGWLLNESPSGIFEDE